ncbi:MAG: periplasmic heavy metal sensor [Pseudomonadota bacterium]
MKRKTLVVILTLAAALLVPALGGFANAGAQQGPKRGGGAGWGAGRGGKRLHAGLRPGPGPGLGRPGMLEALATELGLQPQQKAAVRDIADEMRRQHAKLRAEIDLVAIDLHRELDKDEPSEARVNELIERIGSLEVSIRKSHLLAWLQIRKTLTKEQRQKLAALHAKRAAEGEPNDEPNDEPGPPGPGCLGPGPGCGHW